METRASQSVRLEISPNKAQHHDYLRHIGKQEGKAMDYTTLGMILALVVATQIVYFSL